MSFFMDKLAILSILFTALSISVSPHPLILVICYAIHELGHLFFATLVGAKIKKFKLGAFHLCLSYDCTEISYLKEMLVCFGGIIFNVISALILLLIPIFKGEVIDFFVLCNLSLALMNLYPAAILDGGGVLRSFLYIVTSQEKADKISRCICHYGGTNGFSGSAGRGNRLKAQHLRSSCRALCFCRTEPAPVAGAAIAFAGKCLLGGRR